MTGRERRSGCDERVYAVDRIEGDVAVLVPDDEELPDEDVPLSRLSVEVEEADILRVPVGADGAPRWRRAVTDPELRRQRLEAAAARLKRLRQLGG